MSDFVSVPVPAHLVTEVMRLIADATAVTEPRGADGSREWTRERLAVLYSSDLPSVRLFCQVLSMLADSSPEPVLVDELARRVDLDALTMQKKFGAVTRWMRNHVGDDRWPIDFPGGRYWAMNEHDAALWKAVVADDSVA